MNSAERSLLECILKAQSPETADKLSFEAQIEGMIKNPESHNVILAIGLLPENRRKLLDEYQRAKHF